MGKLWDQLGMSAATGAIGTGLGMLAGAYNDNRQQKQNAELIAQQMAANKAMAKYNQQLALDMWNKTNYGAQVEHMRKAGLNVGLMYGMGGGGGTTAHVQPGNISGATATGHSGEIGMGMQMAIAGARQQAEIENIKADTKLKETEAQKKAGADTDLITTNIEAIKQSINNAKAQEALTKVQTDIADLDKTLKDQTLVEEIKIVETTYRNLEQQLRVIANEADVKDATKIDVIKQASLETAKKMLENTLLKTQNEQGKAQIAKLAADITNMSVQQAQGWEKLSQSEREVQIKKKLEEYAGKETGFKYGTVAEIERGVNIATKIVDTQAKLISAMGEVIPF